MAPTMAALQKQKKGDTNDKHVAGHIAVSRWTRTVDLFAKRLVFMPINFRCVSLALASLLACCHSVSRRLRKPLTLAASATRR
jgi:hypothetical protein